MTSTTSEPSRYLLSARAVRDKAERMLALAEAGALEGWTLNPDALPACADFVVDIVRSRYPKLDVPLHARWRHFVFEGRDLWREAAARSLWRNGDARARAEFDLSIVSVLLDAGAGAAWRYRDTGTGIAASRSEGLALASLRAFESGGFSSRMDEPLRADAPALQRIDADWLSEALQVSPANPLVGVEARAALLNRLGRRTEARPDLFGTADAPRPGGLYDALKRIANGGQLAAPVILETLLEALGPIWENRPSLDGVLLGDCWAHPQLGHVPLHKLTQWLAYSLIEPLQAAGVRVTDMEGLTGLAEYRNGGLFVDAAVLAPRSAGALARVHAIDDPFVVEWRALTIALLDRIAPLVRGRLGLTAAQFPLARVLEGGAWAAGRAIAREKRADGAPPILIHSDGTVF